MKKIVIIFILIIGSFSVFCQNLERPVKDLPIISDVKSKINNAKGWALQDDGAWVSAKNKIPFFSAEQNKGLSGRLGQDNFTVIEIREVVIDNNSYGILIIKYKKEKYEFPMIKQGWSSYEALNYYVFLPSKLSKILPQPVKFGKTNAVNMEVITSGSISHYKSKSYFSEMATNIRRTIYSRNPSPSNLIIAVYPIKSDDKKYIRFKLIRTFPQKPIYQNYLRPENQIKLFHKSYYEVKYEDFKKFVGGILSVSEKNPVDFSGFYKLGTFEYGAGDYYEAISDLSEAIDRNPNSNFLIYAYRANAKHKIGNYYGAIEDYSKAIRLKPKEPKAITVWAKSYCNRGVSKYYLKDKEGACKDWHKAVELGVNDAYKYIKKYCTKP